MSALRSERRTMDHSARLFTLSTVWGGDLGYSGDIV
jgi:hypothetical protein